LDLVNEVLRGCFGNERSSIYADRLQFSDCFGAELLDEPAHQGSHRRGGRLFANFLLGMLPMVGLPIDFNPERLRPSAARLVVLIVCGGWWQYLGEALCALAAVGSSHGCLDV